MRTFQKTASRPANSLYRTRSAGAVVLELIFELLLYTLPQSTGHAVLYVLTFGRVKCDDTTATVLGVLFWIVLLVLVGSAFR